jgi:hypothetical protein
VCKGSRGVEVGLCLVGGVVLFIDNLATSSPPRPSRISCNSFALLFCVIYIDGAAATRNSGSISNMGFFSFAIQFCFSL